MRIALTGASGHIGVNLCRLLLERGHQLRVLIHRNTVGLENLPLSRVQGDLRDARSLDELVAGAEAVIHLAAVISIRGRKTRDLFTHNVEGTRRIVEAARRGSIRRFIHFSSIHALQHRPYDRVLDESRPLALDDPMPYSRSKALAEAVVQRAVEEGLDAVILNPTAVIGPNDYAPSLLGRALILLAQGRLPALVPGGYDWVDARDVAAAAEAAVERGRSGERYILSGRWSDLRELAEMTARVNGRPPRKFVCPYGLARLGVPFLNLYCALRSKIPLYTRDSLSTLHVGHRRISCDKAVRELGFSPRPLPETVRDTLDWFRTNGFIGGPEDRRRDID